MPLFPPGSVCGSPSASFLALMLPLGDARCYRGGTSEGSLCTIFATSCASIIISKLEVFLMPLFEKPRNWGSFYSHTVCFSVLTSSLTSSWLLWGNPVLVWGCACLSQRLIPISAPAPPFPRLGVLSSAVVLGCETASLFHKPQAYSAVRLPPPPPALSLGDPPPRFL